MNYTYIERDADLQNFVYNLQEKKTWMVSLDIEGEQNRHAYGEKLCLIQVYDGTTATIIDPLKINNDSLRMLFESRDIMKLMYDASGDAHLLKRANDLAIKSILDLRPAVDLLNYEKQDLHSIISAELGVVLLNKLEYQRRNWMLRPIPEDALQYALSDVTFLMPLKDILLKKLIEKKLLDRFLLKNLQVQNKDIVAEPKPHYERMPGYRDLDEHRKGMLRRVFAIRDRYAQMYNVPPYRIIANEALVHVVEDIDYISRMRFPGNLSQDAVKELLNELRRAAEEPK